MAEKESLLKRMLRIRSRAKKKKPSFGRQEGYRYKKLEDAWRRPRGRHSKLRKGERSRGRKPSVGYMSPPAVKGKTSHGLEPVRVSSVGGLAGIDPSAQAVVIGSAVGRKKRLEIVAEAEKKDITVLNAYKYKLPHTK